MTHLEPIKVRVEDLVKREPGLTEDEIAERLDISMLDALAALLELQKEGVLKGVDIDEETE